MANTTVSFSYQINSAVVDDVIDTIALNLGYKESAQTKQQFIKQEVGVWLKTKYVQQKIDDAAKTAETTAAESANAIVIS